MIHRPLNRSGEATGRTLWRSLDELSDTDEFRDYLVREFPTTAPEFLEPATRRQFLRVMGASIALAGVSGCAYQLPEKIVPYVKQPDKLIPGDPLFFATAVPLNGYATGVLVESRMGRPIKVEGNPDHPTNLGGTDAFAQASILDLYDPDRSQVVTHNGRVSTYDDFMAMLVDELEKRKLSRGKEIRVVTGTVTSPTLAAQIRELLKVYPEARWVSHEPTDTGTCRQGAKLAFGREVEMVPAFEKADVIVSFDSDFLAWGPSRLRDARKYAERRETTKSMNRMHVVEGAPTITGAMAEHRLAAKPSQIAALARSIAEGLNGGAMPTDEWAVRVVKDLKAHQGKSLVLAGPAQPAEVHALVHALNAKLGNVGEGKPLRYVEAIAQNPDDETSSLATLVKEINSGAATLVVMLGVNPVYDAPADLKFLDAIRKVPISIHLGSHVNETALACHWHLPENHLLESWGDVRGADGTITIQQPLLNPLYRGKSALEIVAALRGRPEAAARELVQDHWRDGVMKDGFDAQWRAAIHDGIVEKSASAFVDVTPKPLGEAIVAIKPIDRPAGLELIFRPDPTMWDGRFSNNGWLQELPKPLSKLTWDNAAFMSPKTAQGMGVRSDDLVELSYQGRTLEVAVWVDPGHVDDAVTLHLGYGRTAAGKVGSGQGFNAYALRTTTTPWQGGGLAVKPLGSTYRLATTQHHNNMEGRDPVKVATAEKFAEEPHFALPEEKPAGQGLSMYPGWNYEGHKWGMAINLNTCIGCNACVIACQSENNCPVVGKDQILAGRNMHWIRIDRYYEGKDENNPEAIYHQPIICMHCEQAPCELVCPVNATVHDDEGLNAMVYNRCVGTRYCSNNCPYKVRRFNFFQYSDNNTETMKMLYNPEVTVRTRGVMEKCTYCVQRIVNHRIIAEQENRPLRDGEILTSCQAACPTRAITFGDMNLKEAAVVKAKADPRNYGLLEQLNTKPRTTYIAKLTNPAPKEG